MSIVFAGITPHPPMLIPTIGKQATEKLVATQQALEAMEKDLYAARPQTILIISPHTSLFTDSFTINAHPTLTSSFDQFGDLTTKRTWNGDPMLAAKISHMSKIANIPIQLVSEERIDHGASVPLFTLTNHLPDIKVLPMGFSKLSPQDHFNFGVFLKDQLMDQDKRIAIIASGDLSHCLRNDGLHPYKPEGEQFDTILQNAFKNHDSNALINLDPNLSTETGECAYRSALILMGILNNIDYTFHTYSYEYPFGIGYLAGQCVL